MVHELNQEKLHVLSWIIMVFEMNKRFVPSSSVEILIKESND